MSKELEKDLLEDELYDDDFEDDDFEDSEEIMARIAINEEIKRIEKQDKIISQKEVKSIIEKYPEIKEDFINALSIKICFKELIEAGIDYQNAITVANNILQNRLNKETVELQSIQIQNSQI